MNPLSALILNTRPMNALPGWHLEHTKLVPNSVCEAPGWDAVPHLVWLAPSGQVDRPPGDRPSWLLHQRSTSNYVMAPSSTLCNFIFLNLCFHVSFS